MNLLNAVLLFSLQLKLAVSIYPQSPQWEFNNPNFCSQNGAVACNTRASITCEIIAAYSDNLVGDNCLNNILAGSDGQDPEVVPFSKEDLKADEDCGYRPVTAKIKYRLCNENEDHDIALNVTDCWIKYDGLQIDLPKANIKPKTCRKVAITREWDLCDVSRSGLSPGTRTIGVEVQLNGKVDVPGDDNHCYCYTFKRSTSAIGCDGLRDDDGKCSGITQNTKPPTAPPTKVPTKVPTKAPTKAPTKVPTKAPTLAPVASKGKGKGKNKSKNVRRVRKMVRN